MVKVEDAIEAKKLALDYVGKMGLAIWSNEVESILKEGDKWVVRIKSSRTYGALAGDIIKVGIEIATGNLISYEKIK